MKEFTLKSTELRDYEKTHVCTVIKAVGGNKLLIELNPPFPGHYYGKQNDLEQVVIVPRYEGTHLVPEVSEWPCRVHICIPDEDGDWINGPFRSLDWGMIEQTKS